MSDFAESQVTPYGLLEAFKAHPSVKPLLENSECKEYAAHLIPEGGYKAMPELCGDGWIVVGDAGQFVNAVHREGSNLAMTTGRMAGELVADLKERQAPCSKAELGQYRQRLEATFVMKDLKKYRGIPDFLHGNKQVFGLYPRLFNAAARNWFRVDGIDKRTKEKEILTAFRKGRTLPGLINDGLKLARAWR